ncbi:hypothetical protein PMAYCL1PPCAC_17288, partial [Pristionchus mayeri]
ITMTFLLLSLLPTLALGITDFTTCDVATTGDTRALCFSDADCQTVVPPFPATFKCSATDYPATSAPTGGVNGCCVGPADTTTTTTTAASVTTTRAASFCIDKLNPLTGVSDCPARASLCTNSVYLDVMRDQCPKTCNFCNSTGTGTGTGTGTNSTTGCLDLLNPSTGVSDCPARIALCTNTIYQPLMRIQCPVTCGFCNSG